MFVTVIVSDEIISEWYFVFVYTFIADIYFVGPSDLVASELITKQQSRFRFPFEMNHSESIYFGNKGLCVV